VLVGSVNVLLLGAFGRGSWWSGWGTGCAFFNLAIGMPSCEVSSDEEEELNNQENLFVFLLPISVSGCDNLANPNPH